MLPRKTLIGLSYALSAYLFWGFAPIYWKQLGAVPSLSVASYRILFGFLFMFIFSLFRKPSPFRQLKHFKSRQWFLVALAALAIGCNWFIFVKAIADGYILEAGLGYYISPMFSVCLSLFFLKERLSLVQWIAVGLCLLAIVYMAHGYGRIPYFGIGLAFTFGWYGLIKKSSPIMAQDGVLFETMLLSPIALVILCNQSSSVLTLFGPNNIGLGALIVGTGLVTAVPQVWFAKATQSLRLSTIGFLQYISPSLKIIIAIFLYQELFTKVHAVTFALIWLAIVLYSWGSIKKIRRDRKEKQKTLDMACAID